MRTLLLVLVLVSVPLFSQPTVTPRPETAFLIESFSRRSDSPEIDRAVRLAEVLGAKIIEVVEPYSVTHLSQVLGGADRNLRIPDDRDQKILALTLLLQMRNTPTADSVITKILIPAFSKAVDEKKIERVPEWLMQLKESNHATAIDTLLSDLQLRNAKPEEINETILTVTNALKRVLHQAWKTATLEFLVAHPEVKTVVGYVSAPNLLFLKDLETRLKLDPFTRLFTLRLGDREVSVQLYAASGKDFSRITKFYEAIAPELLSDLEAALAPKENQINQTLPKKIIVLVEEANPYARIGVLVRHRGQIDYYVCKPQAGDSLDNFNVDLDTKLTTRDCSKSSTTANLANGAENYCTNLLDRNAPLHYVGGGLEAMALVTGALRFRYESTPPLCKHPILRIAVGFKLSGTNPGIWRNVAYRVAPPLSAYAGAFVLGRQIYLPASCAFLKQDFSDDLHVVLSSEDARTEHHILKRISLDDIKRIVEANR